MELEYYEDAVGDCVACGTDAAGSCYWIGMTEKQWATLRPYVEHLYPVSEWSGVRLVFNNLFVPPLTRPLCGPECAVKHKEMNDEVM